MKALTADIASRFARVALGHVTREWPNKLDHVLAGPGDAPTPRALHPIFFGSFDWHSCVHGHWLLARLYRRFPELPEAPAIRALLDGQFTTGKFAGEVAYLTRPNSRGFEQPYGWAWALMLASELARNASDEGRRWSANAKPFAEAFARRFLSYLPLATYPVRAGVHGNTAFALLLALDYARALRDGALAAACTGKLRDWHGGDADCQAWEPSQDDFLSPALIEAAAMHAILPGDEFVRWFARLLPRAAHGEPATLFSPATVGDRSDGKIAHLDGLNLSRAWCWRLIAGALVDEAVRERIERTVELHLAAAMDHIAGDYMGEHWLASFALLALDPDPD